MLSRDTFGHASDPWLSGDLLDAFWTEIHSRLTYLHGVPHLSGIQQADNRPKDVIAFLTTCSDPHFLDFIEFIFQVSQYRTACPDEQKVVDTVNRFLQIDDLPYALTPFVRDTQESELGGRKQVVHVLVAYPRIVRRDSQVLHREAIEPALMLLTDRGFASANQEFLEALTDFRRQDYGDCLTKCGSALESTMKLICQRKRWPYKQTDTAATLLAIVISRSGLESFFEQPLIIVATLRNRLSKSHGSGGQPKKVSEGKARFAINTTAATILFMVEECL